MTPSAGVWLTAVLAVAPSPVLAQEPRSLEPEAEAELEALLRRELASSPATGGVYAVVGNDAPPVVRAFGHVDLDESEPTTPDRHLFHLGTFGELLLSVTAAILAGRDELDLDAPARTYAPDLPEAVGRATLAELLTHTAGLDDSPVVARAPGERWPDVPPEQELALLSDRIVLTGPGILRSPSRFSYLIAGHVLERAGGAPFEALVRDALLAPLDLGHTLTSLGDADGLVPTPGHGWVRDPAGPFAVTPLPDERLLRSHERIWTTGRDFATLVAGWLGEAERPEAEAFRRVSRPRVPDPAAAPGTGAYGFGIEVRHVDDRWELLRSGGGEGHTASLRLLPDRSLAVLVLSNGSDASFPAASSFLLRAFAEAPDVAPPGPPPGAPSPLDGLPPHPLRPVVEPDPGLAGTYRNGAEVLRLVEDEAGALAMDVGTGVPLRIRVLDDGGMDAHLPDGRSAMRFRLHRDEAGELYAVLRGRAFRREGG